ncbi:MULTISPECIES: hypothetical protein [unclassified Rhizobium]|uniref:hypothetical protein n=1 Tax=unclassified Rhizobium TaxID=2613769 RepID=UPI0007EC1788|nr:MULTISPECIES: hypothetical protein [unclassified Rhizobium]ANM13325.1 hypothetical protein AMK05_PB00187 [Rhizobium sp. N324]ANM19726.1 hypothetical protein AMK06_PB00190 [Rhizobium sp. N541]ANM26111.1 hypothetical protein AMK07_PB00190 [Rhizobium sp. N941]OYD01116.1 hypothetical protein AMK08_PB00186 [Rhizobium sp. N4311]
MTKPTNQAAYAIGARGGAHRRSAAWVRRFLSAELAIIVVALACAAMLALPGRTINAAFINDVLIFIDGAHRIAWGQVPNRDFHTALGPLVFYIPAAGYFLSGNFGAAVPLGMAIVLVAFIPAMIRILVSRLDTSLAAALGIFLVLILAAPINLGSSIWYPSFAMFYNRIGWAALGLLLVMYLAPQSSSRRNDSADALAAAFLLLVSFYTKVTYGLAGTGMILIILSDRQQRRWGVTALLLTGLAMVAIEFFWRGTAQHIEDLRAAARVSGGHDVGSILKNLRENISDLAVFAAVASLAIWQSRSLRDLFFCGFCLGAGVALINQNAHSWGIITLYCGATALAQKTPWLQPGHDGGPAGRSARAAGVLPLMVILFLLPPIVHHSAALVLHTALAAEKAGQPLGLPRFADVREVDPPGGEPDFIRRYLDDIVSGGALLQSLPVQAERVFVLDFANPFSAGLGIRPPAGDTAWLHWNRNINQRSYIPPDVLFADVRIVMVPKTGINSLPLQELYGPFLSANFDVVRKTSEWTVYQWRQAKAQSEAR